MIRLLIVDDHAVVREGLRARLSLEPDLEIAGDASSGAAALEMVTALRPDLVLLDLMMPGMGGLEVAQRLSALPAPPRVVVLSMHASEDYVVEAFRNGASGYVVKECSGIELLAAIRDVAAGRHHVSPPFPAGTLDRVIAAAVVARVDPLVTLTPRESEILVMCAEGYTAAQVGLKLFISSRTVEKHRANLMHKLALYSQSDLVKFALRHGLLPPEKA